MTKMRQEKWHDRPRLERLAQVLYPHLADQATQKEMLDSAAVEQKQFGLARRIADGQQTYGAMAKPSPPRNYDNVPGLRRK